MFKQIYCLILLLFLSIQISIAGGPWPQPKGKGFFKLSQWWVTFDQHYTDVGRLDPNITTGVFNTSLYGEYGFTDRFSAILYAPFLSRNYMNNLVSSTTGNVLIVGEAVNSVGDFDIGFKYGLTKPDTKIPVALTLTLGLPTEKPVQAPFKTFKLEMANSTS